jgi:hypothetical protein
MLPDSEVTQLEVSLSTMASSCLIPQYIRYSAVVLYICIYFLFTITAQAASKCEILKASLRYTQEDAPTDLSGVVSGRYLHRHYEL